jgi:hypothetical protein
VLLGVVACIDAADKFDFSGSYTLNKTSGAAKPGKGEVRILRVSQCESSIEVTRELTVASTLTSFRSMAAKENTSVRPGQQALAKPN